MKDLRNRINKKINKNYNQRQKIVSEIKQALDIDFNKISIYSTEIKIFPNFDNPDNINNSTSIVTNEVETPAKIRPKAKTKESASSSVVVNQTPLFRVDLPDTIIGSQRYYYKNTEINNLSIQELNNLKKDLDYILREIEKEIDRLLT